MTLRVAVMTGSRADYGLLHPLMQCLNDDERFDLRVLVTGSHLAEAHGLTLREIEADGMPIAAKVKLPLADSRFGVTKAMAAAVAGIGDALERVEPDVLVLLGDRYEAFAAASAATVMRVPIAHIHGGELTYGAIDDAFRHAITKMSALHFASAEEYRRRIVQMGEAPERVFDVGALAVENVLALPAMTEDEFFERFGIRCDSSTLLVTFHPVSVLGDSVQQLDQLLDALDRLPEHSVIFTAANADAEGETLNKRVLAWVASAGGRASYVTSLGREGYLAAARLAGAVVGNSSSGVIEIPALGVPSVDIGERQAGRIRPVSVTHVAPRTADIFTAIRTAVSKQFHAEAASAPNTYGDGHTAEQICEVLAGVDPGWLREAKRFHDMDCQEG